MPLNSRGVKPRLEGTIRSQLCSTKTRFLFGSIQSAFGHVISRPLRANRLHVSDAEPHLERHAPVEPLAGLLRSATTTAFDQGFSGPVERIVGMEMPI
jgi:hypothetical protein